ncbi:Trk system potassium uptake protein trkA [uncultured Clostridium sp.]|nr:Trk system potassium uptake protein trkA [uncultured Clostridium sp.]
MNIVIIGNGKVGRSLTENLSKKNHDIVVVDVDYTKIHKIMNNYDVKAICGNGVIYDTQVKADVNKSDITIAVTSSDEINLLACIIAKKLGAKATIARVSNIEYLYQLDFMMKSFDLDKIVSPEKIVSEEIINVLRYPNCLSITSFKDESIKLIEIILKKNNRMINTKIIDINKKFKTSVLIYAVYRNKEIFIPNYDFILEENDKVYIIGKYNNIQSLFLNTGILHDNIKSVIIVGGGNVSICLANKLSDLGIKVKIIEKDIEKCRLITHLAPRSKIINEDGTIPDVLLEEGIRSTDVFVSMTDVDEKNIIVSMYASHCNVEKVITKINDISTTNLLESSDLTAFISPKEIISSYIIKCIQEKECTFLKEYMTKKVSYKVTVLEFEATKKDKVTGLLLKNLNIKPNIIILAIIRNSSIIVPTNDDYIRNNDNVILITTNKFLRRLDNIIY